MQAHARLIEDVEHIDKVTPQVLDHLDALRLTTGERIRVAVEAEIAEADRDHVV